MDTISSVREQNVCLCLTTSNTLGLTPVLSNSGFLAVTWFLCSGERERWRGQCSHWRQLCSDCWHRITIPQLTQSALSSGRAGGWPGVGWWLAGWSDSCVPATGQSQQSARATSQLSQPTAGRADPAGWAGGTNGLVKTPGGSGAVLVVSCWPDTAARGQPIV